MRPRDEQKVANIKESAVRLVVKDGIDGFSMQKLAKAAGVSPATLYIYFKDRDDLIVTLAIEAIQRMAEATLRGFAPDMPFAEGLTIQWKNRARYWIENPLEGQFLETIRHSTYHTKTFPVAQRRFSEVMGAFLKRAITNNEVVKLPLEVYWSLAFAPLYQLIKFHQSDTGMMGWGPFQVTDAVLDQALKLVLKGLKP
ncbi:MAG: TetR/AcrR family transcriptional regulator [Bacteroidia bacterium]|nr:TetR/AcrR family transcriptional regulator [Bacteroidia bacterium]